MVRYERGGAMKRFTAVTWLGITLITASLSVTFAEAQERTLVVQVWSGSFERVYKTYVLEPFAKKYGVKVVSSPQGVWYGLVKLKQEVESGAPKVDVSVATYPELLRGTKENLWEPIDAGRIPQIKNLYPQARHDRGVGYLISTYGMAYSRKIEKPQSWMALWDPKYRQKVTFQKNHPQIIIPLVNHLLTGKLTPVNDLDAVFAKLTELKPNLLTAAASVAEIQNLMVNREVVLAASYNGRVYTMQDDGVDVDFAVPKEGAIGAIDYFVVVRNSKNKDLAEKFIDFVLEPEQQANIAKHLSYAPTNTLVKLDEKTAKRMPYGKKEVDALLIVDDEYVAQHLDRWMERWNAWLLEK
jgi:putative spermidine/putrescine transport system substrate-binding protein